MFPYYPAKQEMPVGQASGNIRYTLTSVQFRTGVPAEDNIRVAIIKMRGKAMILDEIIFGVSVK